MGSNPAHAGTARGCELDLHLGLKTTPGPIPNSLALDTIDPYIESLQFPRATNVHPNSKLTRHNWGFGF